MSQSPMIAELFHYPFCPRCRALRLALGELKHEITLREEVLSSWRPEMMALNPSGELPILLPLYGTPIAGLYAISEYLDEDTLTVTADKKSQKLFPGTPTERAEVRRLVDWFLNKFDREITSDLLDIKILSLVLPGKAPPPNSEILHLARQNLRYHMEYLDHLTLNRNWLAGEHLSFADMMAAGHLSILDYLGDVHWDEYPSAKSWYMRLKSRPSFRSLLKDRVPGYPPSKMYAELDF